MGLFTRKWKKAKDGGDDLFNAGGGKFNVAIRSTPDNLLTPRDCFEHRIEISGRNFDLKCETILAKTRVWHYDLEEAFIDGKLIVLLNEKAFSQCLRSLKPLAVVSVKSQKQMDIGGKISVSIDGYTLERGY